MRRVLPLILLATAAQLPSAGLAQVETTKPNDRSKKPAEYTYETAAAPLFKKYCNSCHNASDQEGGLSLATPAEIAKGGDNGPALLPGNPQSSRLVRMMTGELEPKMPPDDMAGPNQKELEGLMAWIEEGAHVDANLTLAPQKLTVPDVKSKVSTDPITALDWSPDGSLIAVARYQRVDILDGKSKQLLFQLKNHPGKVNAIQFSPDSKFLLAATGVTGLKGVALEWDLKQKKQVNQYGGHEDVIYAAVYSPDSKMIATAGYDKKILLWNRGPVKDLPQDKDLPQHDVKPLRELTGHNGAVYGLEFSPNSKVLASASGDETVKLWKVENGARLDTLGQPLKEQFVTRFHPAGQFVLGAGRDNRIRLWKFVANDEPGINPILISRFAHEASIVSLAYSQDGKLLVSSAEDSTIKVWSGADIKVIASFPPQKDVAYGLDLSPKNELAIGRMDGSIDFHDLSHLVLISELTMAKELSFSPDHSPNQTLGQKATVVSELEPNSVPANAQKIDLPASIQGKIELVDTKVSSVESDVDLFRFSAKQGETWVFETNAARSKSPADTKLEVLDLQGNSIRRAKLQAVRDSYFTFRGKDANTSDDFRVHNWEEMELNELLYCNGEVVRLFLYPRGPDSGFKVYPGFGARHNFFDTTPVAHALQEPCYIVKAFPPEAKITPNGLPVFEVFYENDDDAKRKMGSDSKLFFKAPQDGEYLLKITDSRGFHGPKFSYQLSARSPKPDFSVSFSGKKSTLRRGSGQEFSIKVNRLDQFNGEITVQFENVPPGIRLPEQLTIQENHFQAFGTIQADADAKQPTKEQIEQIKVTAFATINSQKVRKDLGKITDIKLVDSPKIQTRIVPSYRSLTDEQKTKLFEKNDGKPVVLTIRPGTTISASLVVKRRKHGGDIDFGNAESGRNLPHGVFVDNIGLNGLRIIKGQGDVREIFITAAKWVPEQERLFHLKANNVDGETTLPVLLRVKN